MTPVHLPEPEVAAAPQQDTLSGLSAWRALAGFFLSGVLLSFLGAVLPSWGHHLYSQYGIIAMYFVGLAAGLAGSGWLSPVLLRNRGIRWTLAFACLTAAAGVLWLAFVTPPHSPWWRVGAMAVVGCGAGLLHSAMFHAISPVYRRDPGATVNLAGILFGIGCLTVAVLVSGAFYLSNAPAMQVWIAIIPAAFGWVFWKTNFSEHAVHQQPSPGAIFSQLKSPGAVLLSLLLFFQLGNEWGMAGWLPVFLIQRLGSSPTAALRLLVMYWLALLVGRAAARWILWRVPHGRLLLGCVVASVFGCVILSVTNNQFGAITGVMLVGGAFAPIYPLVIEKIGHRFPDYHPGVYNGIFSFAMAGGFVTPAIIGWLASIWGVRMVMLLPVVGSILVFVLLALIWLEARLSTHARPPRVTAV